MIAQALDYKVMYERQVQLNAKLQMDQRELRDQFAMAALTGLISDHNNMNSISQNAQSAYMYADAMMEARK